MAIQRFTETVLSVARQTGASEASVRRAADAGVIACERSATGTRLLRDDAVHQLLAHRAATGCFAGGKHGQGAHMDILLIDSGRQSNPPPSCGIFVRAQTPNGEFVSADLSLLTRASLELWLRSDVERARRTVLHMLGHY